MLGSNLDRALDIILPLEGGYVNDPRDPGGETKFGLSARAFPNLCIADLTLDMARSLYRENYWMPLCADFLPGPLALVAFDGAINQGLGTAARLLQLAAHSSVDGVIGPLTLQAVNGANDQRALVIDLLSYRALRYARGDLATYGLGWFRRLMTIAGHALGDDP